MGTSLADLFEQTVANYSTREALVDVRLGKRWTFQEWDQEINQLANAFLKAGVTKGDRVSTFLFNTSEMATTLFACAKIGAVFNPINFRLKSEELAFILNDATPKIVVFEDALSSVIHEALEFVHSETSYWSIDGEQRPKTLDYHVQLNVAPTTRPKATVVEDDLYAIMYTSGTTGHPKGVLHRHRDMVEQSLALIGTMHLSHHDRGLVSAPMFHCAELHCAFIPRVQSGAASVILHHFEAKHVLQTIEDEHITTLFAAPAMWNALLQEDISFYNLKSLISSLYGGAPMAPALVRRCKEAFGIKLIQAYGMTEMGPAITFQLDEDQLTKAGSAGKACYNHEVRVVRKREDGPSEPDDSLPPGEIGEIIVKGNSMMSGYFNRPEASEKALYKGWYHSGDLGYMDEEHFLYVADRVDDMIISGGENIYPRQVEDVLFEHEGVLDVAVLGAPDENWGETVVAYVSRKDPSLTEAELDTFCKTSSKLANYKRPRRYIFLDELPRNASGKLQKFKLRGQTRV
ncbi:MAG TPA: fatty acid--CoA ligase [Candidatus Angelobacter sp.]|nr:fatty acid--CoA ligase [Candidatus Angelobacter sp.]